jgi:hypothetical protein
VSVAVSKDNREVGSNDRGSAGRLEQLKFETCKELEWRLDFKGVRVPKRTQSHLLSSRVPIFTRLPLYSCILLYQVVHAYTELFF